MSSNSTPSDASQFSPDPLGAVVHELLEQIGEDPTREGLVKTPERSARAWRFLTRGYTQDIQSVINEAIFEEDVDEMVVVREIDFFSLCEHHLLPFWGKAHIGYIPKGKVIGLSKMPRLVEVFSRRLQLQERMTLQIARAIEEAIQPRGVAIVTEACHMCMMMRGVEKVNSNTIASAMLGAFRNDRRTRAEFLSLINHKLL
ncbi:MAG: GTP cyclohydrolase I FolE [bacterium]|jgi:GTP cyclohydrolase I|nr:GTP cyclohydrolase I FolE [bacterium]